MSLTERVVAHIYHETQEPDSSLCAQHCLNNLLQDSIFSAADLAELARQLDHLEAQARGADSYAASVTASAAGETSSSSSSRSRRQASPPALGRQGLNADRSRNMDDSGFFSSQVMDEALKPFSLQLVRWRSERMRPLHGAPESQQAFVLNFKEHWFAMRRFGHSKHFWYNLNSFYEVPKHVSPLYLGLQIDQAEHEGYSVFAVVPASGLDEDSSSSSTGLPSCNADEVVYSIADDARGALGLGGAFEGAAGIDRQSQAMMDDETIFTSSGTGPAIASGFGNEDEALNRAIEESLRNQGSAGQHQLSASSSGVNLPSSRTITNYDEDPELAAAIAASLVTRGDAQTDVQGQALQAGAGDEDVEIEDEGDEEEKPMTAEEMRKARLARFG